MLDLMKMLVENPGSAVVEIIVLGTAIFYVGINYDSIRYMKQNMVTKKDLELALLKFGAEMRKEFVSKDQCKACTE